MSYQLSATALAVDINETASDLYTYLEALYALAPSSALANAQRHLEALIEAFGDCAN